MQCARLTVLPERTGVLLMSFSSWDLTGMKQVQLDSRKRRTAPRVFHARSGGDGSKGHWTDGFRRLKNHLHCLQRLRHRWVEILIIYSFQMFLFAWLAYPSGNGPPSPRTATPDDGTDYTPHTQEMWCISIAQCWKTEQYHSFHLLAKGHYIYSFNVYWKDVKIMNGEKKWQLLLICCAALRVSQVITITTRYKLRKIIN